MIYTFCKSKVQALRCVKPAHLIAFCALQTGLAALFLGAAFHSYRQYRKYSEYERQIRALVGNQDMMDIGFGDLKRRTVSSKGNWPILRKLGIEIPSDEELSYDEIFHRSGIDFYSIHQALVEEMIANNETICTVEQELEYEEAQAFVVLSLSLLSDQEIAFYALDVTSAKKETDDLRERADRDNLTKAYRRKAFIDKAEQMRADDDSILYFSIVDIDLFKRVNDTYGHEIGDRVIRMIAGQMMKAFGPSGCVGRWGGEEFVVVFPAADKREAVGRMEEFLHLIERTSIVVDSGAGKKVNVTVSAGVTEWTKDESLRLTLSEADTALYVSKKSGRNRVTFFES